MLYLVGTGMVFRFRITIEIGTLDQILKSYVINHASSGATSIYFNPFSCLFGTILPCLFATQELRHLMLFLKTSKGTTHSALIEWCSKEHEI